MQGNVKWFNEAKGYGFVTSGDKEYFVHYKGIAGDGFKTLREGDAVSFDTETSPKGMVAVNVKLV